MTINNVPNVVGSIADWQNILNGNGYQPPLRITGELDDTTKETTKKFQKDLALPVTGSVDVSTWAAGLNHTKLPNWSPDTPPIRTMPPVATTNIQNNPHQVGSVAAWQNILNGNGYQPLLRITGEMDDATKETTRKFQKDVGLSVTGDVDVTTWAAGLNHSKLRSWSSKTPPIRSVELISKTNAEYVFNNSISDILLTDLNNCLEKFSISTDSRIRHFLAQVAHESGGLRWLKEIDQGWYIPANFGLPAIAGSDGGYKYRGAGALQLSLPDNYKDFANFMGDSAIYDQGCPYVADKYPFSSAGFWWWQNGMNALVDSGASVDEVGARVNGKYLPNNYLDRRNCYERALAVI